MLLLSLLLAACGTYSRAPLPRIVVCVPVVTRSPALIASWNPIDHRPVIAFTWHQPIAAAIRGQWAPFHPSR